MVARLPQPGGDDGTWGNILNDFLGQAHNADGSLKTVDSTNIGGLAPVATSGSYADLTNKPSAAALGAIAKDTLVFNVTDHGVVADGTTDNTAAFTSLVATVAAAGGGVIWFPPNTQAYIGQFNVSGYNVPITVLGYGAILFGLSGKTVLTLSTNLTGASAQILSAEGLTIKGSPDQTSDGILITDTSHARVIACYIRRTNNAIRIQNNAAGQASEATAIRDVEVVDCITGLRFEIVSGNGSFDETYVDNLNISSCTTGIYMPTGANFVRSNFYTSIWVGRTGSAGVAVYCDSDVTRMFARFGGELAVGATSGVGLQPGPNATGFDLADIALHFQGTLNPNVDISNMATGQVILYRHGLGFRSQSRGAPASNVHGPFAQAQSDAFPRIGFSLGSASNAPFPGGRYGIFWGSGSTLADTVLFRQNAHVLEQGPTDVFWTGHAPTASVPAASIASSAGPQYFNDTLKQPIWTDGTNWRVGGLQFYATQTLAANGAVTLDASTGSTLAVSLQANATSSSITNAYLGQQLTISWIQDATGSRTYAWPSNCKFAAGAAPTASTTANYRDMVTFVYDGANWQEISRSIGNH